MARKQSTATNPSPGSDSRDERIDRLTAAVERLADEVHVLREALDDLREHYEYALRNREPPAADSFVPLTSLPRNPLAADFGERINRVRPDDVQPEAQKDPRKGQGKLF